MGNHGDSASLSANLVHQGNEVAVPSQEDAVIKIPRLRVHEHLDGQEYVDGFWRRCRPPVRYPVLTLQWGRASTASR